MRKRREITIETERLTVVRARLIRRSADVERGDSPEAAQGKPVKQTLNNPNDVDQNVDPRSKDKG